MDTTLLSSNRKNTKVLSFKEKDFLYGIPLWKFMLYGDESSTKTTININPDSSTDGFVIDSFCEKPPYIPIKNKRDVLYSDAKNFSLYFPLSDKLEGYNLYDVFYGEYIPAKGTFLEGDENQYYEIRNGAYRKKRNIEVGDSLNNFFLKIEGIPLEKNSKVSSNIYKNTTFTKDSYGEKINFFFDGIAPGTSDTNCNLLYGKTIQCETKNPNENVEITESRSVYRTKSFDIVADPDYNVFIYYEDIEIPNDDDVDGYTFSFIARLDDYSSKNGVEDVNNRKQFSVETKATISVFIKELNDNNDYYEDNSLSKNITLSTDWSQYSFYIDNNSINGKIIKIAIAIGTFSSTVKTSAFLLNKGNYIVSFDDRFHIKHNEPVLNQRKYPVLINFLSSSEYDSIRMSKVSSWTINYKRFINASANSESLSKIDYLGDGLTFGYPIEGYDSNAFVGKLENVFIIYDSENLSLRYKVFSDSESIEKTYTYVSSPNFDCVVPDDTNVHFNIILGGYVENGTIKINNFTKYSDFMAFPYVLSKDEIEKMNGSLMSVSFDSKTYEERYVSLKAEDYSNTKIYATYDSMVRAEPVGREDILYVITNENNAKYIWNGNTYVEGKQIFNLRENLTVLRSANFFETKNI